MESTNEEQLAIDKIQNFLDKYIHFVDSGHLGSLITRKMTADHISTLSKITGSPAKAIVAGLVVDERMDLLRPLVRKGDNWIHIAVEFASGRMLKELGVVRIFSSCIEIADRNLWIAQWRNGDSVGRRLLLMYSYHTLPPQETVHYLLQIEESDRPQLYTIIHCFSQSEGYSRWTKAVIALYESQNTNK